MGAYPKSLSTSCSDFCALSSPLAVGLSFSKVWSCGSGEGRLTSYPGLSGLPSLCSPVALCPFDTAVCVFSGGELVSTSIDSQVFHRLH